MSSSFFVEMTSEPTFDEVLGSFDEDGLRCAENPIANLTGPWPEGVLHFYRTGQSTRSVEIAREGSEIQVRILSLSSPVDYDLAFRFVERFGGERIVRHEELGEFPASQATERFRNDWMLRDLAASITAMIEAVRSGEPGKYASVPGAVRPVYIGSRLLDTLSNEEGEVDPMALIEAVKRIQYIEGYQEVEQLPAWGIAGPNSAVAIWDLATPSLFAEVTHVGVALSDTNAYVPVAALPEVAGERFRFLDDAQFVIDAIPEDERAAILDRARTHGVSAGGGKKWWQFWK